VLKYSNQTAEEVTMADLIVESFDNEFKAEKVRVDLMEMQHEHLIDLEEAAVVVHKADGGVRLHHNQHFTLPGLLTGGFVGTLAGLMLLNPFIALVGMVTGAGLGAIIGALKEVGIDDDFMKDIASHLKPGTSALFILAKRASPDKIVGELKKYGGKILQTSLSHEDETRLHAAIEKALKENHS
jgi:uncharacterized membrane protein